MDAELMEQFQFVNPESLGAPRGYSNGVLTAAAGRLLFIAGQIAWNEAQELVSDNLVKQFDRALFNVISVYAAAGGRPGQVASLIILVTKIEYYRIRQSELG